MKTCEGCGIEILDEGPHCRRCAEALALGGKFDGEKLRTDLIPVEALEAVARILTIGAKKYADRNWERGMHWSRPYGATLRHLFAWWRGEDIDQESGEHHLAHAACELMFALQYALQPARYRKYDDRPRTAVRQ